MRSIRSTRTAAVAASLTVGLFLVLACGSLAAEDEAGDRTFSYSHSANAEVLRLWHTGSWGRNLIYSLHGDGRLEMKVTWHADGSVLKEREIYLTRAEVDTLLETLVSHSVVESSSEELEQLYRDRMSGRIPHVIDGGATILIVRLNDYRTLDGTDLGTIEHRIGISNARTLSDALQRVSKPPIPALSGMLLVDKQLYQYWKLAGTSE